MPRTGKWNGKSATVLRRDGDAYVIQVREVEAMARSEQTDAEDAAWDRFAQEQTTSPEEN